MKSLLNKRIAVFGAGAVGTYFGFKLLQAGFSNVEFIARSSYKALNSQGLKVIDYANCDNSKNPKIHKLKVNAKKELSGSYDLILMCVKSKDTIESANIIKNHLNNSENNKGIVVSIQNGVENPTIIENFINKEQVIAGVIYLTAVMQEKGVLKFDSDVKIIFGHTYGEKTKQTDFLEEVFSTANLQHRFSSNIKEQQWSKLMLNIVLNPLTALFRKTFYNLSQDNDALSLSKHLFDEARNAAKINGVHIEESLFEELVERNSKFKNFKSSMFQDIEANRKPEVDAILGVVVRSHESIGETAPYSDSILKVMNVMFGHWYQISPVLAADVLVINGNKVLLIDRKNEPFGWAIPGGLVDLYETIENAAIRELEEETLIQANISDIELLGVYSNPKRDPRGHTVSAVYVYFSDKEAVAQDDAKDAAYFDISNLPENLAFDHKEILMEAKKKYFNK